MPSQGTAERKVWRHGGKSIYYINLKYKEK